MLNYFSNNKPVFVKLLYSFAGAAKRRNAPHSAPAKRTFEKAEIGKKSFTKTLTFKRKKPPKAAKTRSGLLTFRLLFFLVSFKRGGKLVPARGVAAALNAF